MKRILLLYISLCLCGCGWASPEGFVRVAVVDEEENRLEGCRITVSFENDGKYIRKTGISQTNTFFEAQAPASLPRCTVIVAKEGYYKSRRTKMFTGRDAVKNRYEPWGEVRTLTLRKKIEAKDMICKSVDLRSVPTVGKPVGFDLEKSDWVAPHGSGVINDFIFSVKKEGKWISEYTVSFNNEGDGIQEYEMPSGISSVYRWPHKAPDTGYNPLLKKITRGHQNVEIQESYLVKKMLDANYIFRVRTELDKEGNVLSASYGRILGEIKIYAKGGVQFRYCLNPDSASRSLESTHTTSP